MYCERLSMSKIKFFLFRIFFSSSPSPHLSSVRWSHIRPQEKLPEMRRIFFFCRRKKVFIFWREKKVGAGNQVCPKQEIESSAQLTLQITKKGLS
jgi:hypothetical protein